MGNNVFKQVAAKAKEKLSAQQAYQKQLNDYISGTSNTAMSSIGVMRDRAQTQPDEVQRYLSSNKMARPSSLAEYDADTVRNAITDRAAITRSLSEAGYFDNESNAYGGNAHMTSTKYLRNLLDQARGNLSASLLSDEQNAADIAKWKSGGEKDYLTHQANANSVKNWLAVGEMEGRDYENPTDEDMLYWYNTVNGTDYKSLTEMYSAKQQENPNFEWQDAYYPMIDLWFEGVENGFSLPEYTGMADPTGYQSQTNTWQERIGSMERELERRDTVALLEDDARAMPNFAELSVYQDTASDGTTGNRFVDFWNAPRTAYVGKYEDKNYFINNPIPESQKSGATEYSMAVQAYLNDGLDQMTSYERSVYNAYVNNGQQDKADEYLSSIKPMLLQRRAEGRDVKYELLATNPWTAAPAAIASVGGDILSGVMAPVQLTGEALGLVEGQNDAIYDINRSSATVTGAQMQALGEIDPLKDVQILGKSPLQLAYSGFKGALTNLGRAALGQGSALALAGGQSVSGSLYENAGREDMSTLALATQALLDGLVEVGTEKIGLDAFFNKGLPGAKEYVKQLVLSEMGEEALAYLGGEAIDHAVSAVFGHKGDYATGEELWRGLGETLLTTAISSSLMSVPGATQIRSQNKAAGKGISTNDSINQVLEIADSMDKKSTSYAEAQNVKAAMEGGKKVSLNKLGRLANAMQKELGEEYGKIIGRVADDTIVDRMVELGDSQEIAQKNVQAVKKVAQGQNLTAQERADLTESTAAIRVVEELAGEAETSGEMAVKMQMRTMEAAAGIRRKQLGLQEAVRGKQDEADIFATEDENAPTQTIKAKPGTGAVTFLGEASSNQQVTGVGTEVALSNRMRSMTASQRNTVNGIKAIAKATGVNMVLFESTKEGRAAGVQNGSFVRGTNTIYLDINAGISTEAGMKGAKESGVLGYAMIRTLSHELTHFIENNSKEGYAALMEQAKREFAAKGKDWDKLVVAKAKISAAQGEKLTRTGAEAEVLADACEMMLQDTAAIERLARQNPSLKDKIAGFIKSFVQKIQKALRAIGAGSKEAKALMEMRDGLMQYSEELTRLWGAGLEEAVGKAQSVELAGEEQDQQIQFAIRDGIITTESTEQERYNVLKNAVLKLAHVNTDRLEGEDLEQYNTRKKSAVEKPFLKLAAKLGITKVDLENSYIDFPFRFSNGNLRKNLKHQLKYGGTFEDHAKMMSCLEELVDNAIPIEMHPEKKTGTKRANPSLRNVYVLISAYRDGNDIVPVQFEVKEFWNNDNGLYVAVALTKMTPEVVEKPAARKTGVTALLFSEDTISLRYLFENVNSADYKFFKYIPDGFLNDEQKAAKARALAEQAEEYASYGKDDDDSSPDGIEIDDDTESAYPTQKSIRTWAESDYVAHRNEAAERLAKTIGVSTTKAKKWIDDVNSISAIILDNKARLDYIPTAVEGVSAFKSNPEYGGSIDMSTICAKRRLATGTLDAIQNALGDAVLTKDDFLHIREMMKERGHEVACGLCFVESSRKNLSKYTKQFLDQFNATHPDNQVSMTDFNTVDGLERTRLLNQEAYAEYEKFMNKLAQRKPKLFEKRTEYRHEILQKFKKDTTVGVKNINGGLRLQSFSDFEIVHLIDMMQVITDMASVGLAGQAYTKVPDFAWALGDTGLKINLSLIAKDVDEDGNLIFDDVEGMNHEEAKRLRDAYSENVGTIVVAFTDEQIMAAMKSDFVDFIIPFHRSQWQKSDYKKLGLPEGTKDYTMHQNEKLGRKRVKENYMPNDYWKPNLSGKENAEYYLKKCAADGRTPKFAKFLQNNGDGTYDLKADGSTDGYWKLLIDFKMYDNDGNFSPQNPVQPNFNMDEAKRMLDTYNGIHDSFPVAQDVVDDFVKEYQGNKGGIKLEGGRVTLAGRQMSRRATDAEYMQAVERGDMATAQRMVDEAAKAAGYEPVKQYHGTRNFGFKKFDLNRMDDKISIFVTDNRRIAESYSRENADLPLKDAQNMDRYDFMQQPSKVLEPYVRKHLTTRLRVPTEREMREHTDRESAYILSSTDWVTDYFAAHEDSLDRETLQALHNIIYYGGKLAAIPTANLEDETDGYKLRMKYDDAVYDLSWANRDVYDELSSVIGRTVSEAANKLISARFSDPFYDESIGAFVNKWDVTDKLEEKLFSGIYELYGDQKNLLEIDAKDANWNKIDGTLIDRPGVWVTTRDVAEYAKARGYNGARIKDLRDSGGLTAYNGASTITIYFDNTSLKSADPVTYDDDGNVIPLSERFTRSETDIRYSQRLPDDISTREYLADADSSIAANAEQANALEIYKTRIAAYREATQAVDQAKAALAATTDRDESIKARNRFELLQKQQSRAYDQLIAAEDTKHIRELTGATTEFIQQQLAGKTEADIASMIAEAESEIASLTEQLDGLKGASREQTEAVKEQIRMLKARVTRLRNSATRKLLETRQHYQEMFQRDRTRREINAEAAKKANHIKAVVKRLDDRIRHETDYHNVKKDMKPAVRKLVETFLDGFGNLVFDQKKADRLLNVYRELDKLDSDESSFYSDDVEAMLEDLAALAGEDAERRAGGLSLMDNAETKLAIYSQVADIADNIWHMVQMADEVFVNGKTTKFSSLGDSTGNAMLERKDYKQLYGVPGKIQRSIDDTIRRGNMIPTYFFESLDNEGLQSLFDSVMNGQTRYAQTILDGHMKMQEARRKYNYADWSESKPVKFRTAQGHDITLTPEQMMWVYATAKRERSNELAATDHLGTGGFRYEGEVKGEKGLAVADKPHKLGEGDVQRITDMLTADQKAYADELVEYLSNDMAEVGNAASMEMFGIRKYQEKYYFPFKTASEQRYQRSDAGSTSTTNDSRVKHSSFTHRLTRHANNTLVMGDFSSIIADHINQMATYASFMNPIESMNRVLNYKVEEDDGTLTTIRALLGRKYGDAALRYVQDFMKDINGGAVTDNRGMGMINSLVSAFKRGAVAASLSVAVQQPTAYVRAFAYMNPKYFAHLTGERTNESWDEVMRYSGTAVIKDMGKFDVGLGQTANEWIAEADNGELSAWERTKRFWPWGEGNSWSEAKKRWDNLLTALPGYMDKVTWTHIWKAVKAEQRDLHPNMDPRSEAFLQACGKRFDYIINHTQVYDSVLSKSNLMRSKNALNRMATSFMSEPTLTANVLYSAVKGKHTKLERGKMIATTIASNILAAAAAAAVSAWNDDDDDRKAMEKYADKFTSLAIDNLNPLGMLPYLSDVSSMLEGYSVERADASVVEDLIKHSQSFFGALQKGEGVTWKQVENFAGTLLNLVGVPAKNISRDVRRLKNAVTTDWTAASPSSVGFATLENLPYGMYADTKKAYYKRYVGAVLGGNKQRSYNIKDYMTSSKGTSESAWATGVRDVIKAMVASGDMTAEEATAFLREHAPYKNDKDNIKKPKEWAGE